MSCLTNNSIIKRILISITLIFPLLFSIGACSDAGILRMSFAAVIISLFINEVDSKSLMPTLFNFLILSFVFSSFGSIAATVSLFSAAIVLCFGKYISQKINKLRNSSLISGIMLGTAIVMTVMQTTGYFGIGAFGLTAREMIASYLSLGFHGNWRGVLYGTITMVILITFPRKFKAASKVISPMFIALAVSLGLNYFLNPPDMITAINEAGSFTFDYDVNISFFATIIAALLGTVIGLSNIYSMSAYEYTKKDYVTTGIINIVLSPLICFLPKKIDKSILKGVPAALILTLLIFFFKDILTRLPIHSCAVILIVSAWENVKWKRVKTAFTNGILNIILLLVPIFVMLLV